MMAHMEDLIEYFRTLRRGYDRGHFTDRVKELAGLVNAAPLGPEDFKSLFKIWLELEIPISHWSSLGVCLIPAGLVDDDLVRYTARWLLAGLYSDTSPSRLGVLLDWLTAALDHGFASEKVMDECYIIFQTIFHYERYACFVIKLLYKLTKPHDVSRYWTQKLLELLRTRDTPQGRAQVTVLLNLFKSYRPECVPESVPSVSVHSAFHKINDTLLNRFRRVQNYRNTVDTSTFLSWRNNLRAMGMFGKGMAASLIPDVEFNRIGSQLYSGTNGKTCLHFHDGASVLAYSLRHRTERPAQLLSMLCNDTGAVMLLMMPTEHHIFLSRDLNQLLHQCFLLEDGLYTREEKADMLHRVGHLQELLLQAVPVVSNFLVEYLAFWNGCDYFDEVLRLCEWVHLGTWQELHAGVLRPLLLMHCSLPRAERCAVPRTLTTLYRNLLFARTKERNFFLGVEPNIVPDETLHGLARFLQDMCTQSLRTRPEDPRELAVWLWTYEALAEAELASGAPRCTVAPPLLVALALTTHSAHALNSFARLLLSERRVFVRLRKKSDGADLEAEENMLTRYKADLSNCLWRECVLSERHNGLIFSRLPQERVDRLLKRWPSAEACWSAGRHPALAPHTYGRFEALDVRAAPRDLWLRDALAPRLPDLAALLARVAGA